MQYFLLSSVACCTGFHTLSHGTLSPPSGIYVIFPTKCQLLYTIVIQIAGGRTGRECLECYAIGRINVKITEGKVYRTVVRPALMYGQIHGRCRRHRKENAKMDVRSYEAGQDHK